MLITEEQAIRGHHLIVEEAKKEQFKRFGRDDLPPALVVVKDGVGYGGAGSEGSDGAVMCGVLTHDDVVKSSLLSLWVELGRKPLDLIGYFDEAWTFTGDGTPPNDLGEDFRTNPWTEVTESVVSVWYHDGGRILVRSQLIFDDGGQLRFGVPTVGPGNIRLDTPHLDDIWEKVKR